MADSFRAGRAIVVGRIVIKTAVDASIAVGGVGASEAAGESSKA